MPLIRYSLTASVTDRRIADEGGVVTDEALLSGLYPTIKRKYQQGFFRKKSFSSGFEHCGEKMIEVVGVKKI